MTKMKLYEFQIMFVTLVGLQEKPKTQEGLRFQIRSTDYSYRQLVAEVYAAVFLAHELCD